MKKGFLFTAMLISFFSAWADEGMYPLSEIFRINFKKAGFKMTQQQMFSPGAVSYTHLRAHETG
jgi:hypothetical protein